MKIAWFSWKDINHPQAGGAEKITHNLLSRMSRSGHKVVLITSKYEGSSEYELLDEGYEVYRGGGRFSVYLHAFRIYKRLRERYDFDVLVEEVNTVPFFTKFYVESEKERYLFFHQLAREIWFYQMFFPISLIGYLIEPLYLRLINSLPVITVSESTKLDLVDLGFNPKRIKLISEGLDVKPILESELLEYEGSREPVWVSLGQLRPMKNTLEIVKAFLLFFSKTGVGRLLIAGGGGSTNYGSKVLEYVSKNDKEGRIEYLGRVSEEKKMSLFKNNYALLQASVREGWGLTVSEAGLAGMPTVSYDVHGLRDSVVNGVTGLLAESNSAEGLAKAMVLLYRSGDRDRLGMASYRKSCLVTYDKSYHDFMKRLGSF